MKNSEHSRHVVGVFVVIDTAKLQVQESDTRWQERRIHYARAYMEAHELVSISCFCIAWCLGLAKPSGLRTKHQHQNQSQHQPPSPPVSARNLAATLWEMNEIPSPSPSVRESSDERQMRKKEAIRGRERIARSVHSGSLPPHLSDPSHSLVSEVRDLLLL